MKDNWFAYGVLTAALGLGACSSTDQNENAEAALAREFGEESTNPFTVEPADAPAAPSGETASADERAEIDTATQPDIETLRPELVAPKAPRFDDQTQKVLDAFVLGKTSVQYYIAIHRDSKVGQYADHSWYRYTVVGHIDGLPLVEQAFEDYAIAYLIDPESRHDSDDVIRAWVGRKGYAATEVKVPYPQVALSKATQMRREPFSGLKIGSQEYDGYIESPRSSPATTRYWKTRSLPFDGLIQKKVGGNTTRIKYGTDGKPTLDWSHFRLDSQH